MSRTSLSFQQIGLALFACLLWSTAFAGVKFGLQYMAPLQFAGLRFMLSGLLILPLCGSLSAYLKSIRTHWRIVLRVALFQTFLLYGFFFWGMTLVSGALAAIVVGASPLVTALVAHVAVPGDRMDRRKSLSIGLAILGIALISFKGTPFSARGVSQLAGIGLLISSSIMSAVGNVLVFRDKSKVPPLVLNSAQIFTGGLLLFVVSWFTEPRIGTAYPSAFYLVFFYLSLMSALAFSLWFVLLKQPGVKVSELNLWKFVMPVFGAILSWIVLPGESPDRASIVGMICVSSSILFYFTPQKRSDDSVRSSSTI